MASTPIPSGLKPTHNMYKDLVDCGFNLGMEVGSIGYYKNQFRAIGELNFKYLIRNPELLTSARNNYIKEFKDNPYVAGWSLGDEPKFENIEEYKNALKDMINLLPADFIYINLVGMISKSFTGPYKNYKDYLNFIQSKLAPNIWSYDFYPIYYRNGKLNVDYDIFYNDLEAVSKIAEETQKPFWTYCESMAYKAKDYSRPAATEAYLRFEAFTALAYGAQGIVYWTYAQRESNEAEIYTSALVNLDGKKTPAWYAAKKVNNEIKKFNDVFYQCEVKDVRHTGDKIYSGTKKLSGPFGPFKMVRSGSSGVVVSLIENNGNSYVVIVNRDVLKKQKISLELNSNTHITNLTANPVKIYSWRQDINIALDKGGYVIFKINN